MMFKDFPVFIQNHNEWITLEELVKDYGNKPAVCLEISDGLYEGERVLYVDYYPWLDR